MPALVVLALTTVVLVLSSEALVDGLTDTVGSSIQIVLFVLPVLVLVGAAIGKPLGILFNPAAMVAVVASVFAVQWVSDDSSLDWFEGAFLVLVNLLLFSSSFFLL